MTDEEGCKKATVEGIGEVVGEDSVDDTNVDEQLLFLRFRGGPA